MITPTLKDAVLKFLIERSSNMSNGGDLDSLAGEFLTNADIIHEILRQFGKRGFVTYHPYMGGGYLLQLHADAHDYYLAGGMSER